MIDGNDDRDYTLPQFAEGPITKPIIKPYWLDAYPVGRGVLARGIYARNFHGKRLAIGPNCAILEIFLLPDGDGALEGIDEPAAGVKCRRAMGGCDDHQHAGFANLQPSQPVNHGYI